MRLSQSQAFIGDEEEALFLTVVCSRNQDRPSQGSPKVVLTQRLDGVSVVIVESVVGIEEIVAKIVEYAAMKVIGS